MKDTLGAVAAFAAVIAMIAVVLVGGVAGCGAYKGWHRGQKVKDAQNKVRLTHVGIQTAYQQADIARAQVDIVKQEANKRYWAATGVRRAQDEIRKTLTPLYVQWEAIQAQMKMADSSNHTEVYIPSGANGVPLVKTTP